MRRNPNDSSLQAQIDELRTLLTANPLRSATVESDRTRFYAAANCSSRTPTSTSLAPPRSSAPFAPSAGSSSRASASSP